MAEAATFGPEFSNASLPNEALFSASLSQFLGELRMARFMMIGLALVGMLIFAADTEAGRRHRRCGRGADGHQARP